MSKSRRELVSTMRARREEAEAEDADLEAAERQRRGPRTVEEALARLPRREAASLRKELAFWCVPITNPARSAALLLTSSPRFENVILVLIVLSSVVLAVDSPLLDPASGLAVALGILDLALTVVFGLEMLSKQLARGLLLHRGAYLRSPWNVLDGTLVVISVLAAASTGVQSLQGLRSLRALRALRPLRVIARNEGMRVVVNALFSALPSIANVFVVFVLFILIFAIVGVGFLKGGLGACAGPLFDALPPERASLVMDPVPFEQLSAEQRGWGAVNGSAFAGTTSKAVCEWMGAEWTQRVAVGFDNVLVGSVALFGLSTTEGWVTMMQAGVESRGIDMQPARGAAPAMALLFILFILIGSFFFLNAFVGVTIDNFSRSKEGAVLATTDQREWIRLTDVVLNARPIRMARAPRAPWRRRAFVLVHSGWFEPFIMGCILLNAVVMAASFFGMPAGWAAILDATNTVFTLIFTAEAAFKLAALGWGYWHSAWNIFDFLVVTFSVAGILVDLVGGVSIGPVASVVRTVRVGRVIRLVKQARSLRLLFRALLVTLPGLANIASLLGLFIVIYGILGQQLFAHVRFGSALNEDANFRGFGQSLMTLVRVATGEDWNTLQADLAVGSDCSPNPQWDDPVPRGCGDVATSLTFFTTFTLTVSFVLLNLVVGLLLEAFSNEGVGSKLSAEQIEQFSEAWAELDPDATGFVPASRLGDLLQRLPVPMGFGRHNEVSDAAVRRRTLQLRITTWKAAAGAGSSGASAKQGGQVQFADVMLGLGRWLVEHGGKAAPGAADTDAEKSEAKRRASVSLPEGHPAVKRLRELRRQAAQSTGSRRLEWDVRHAMAAGTISDAYRTFRLRWRLSTAMDTVQRAWEARQRAIAAGQLLSQEALARAVAERIDEEDEDEDWDEHESSGDSGPVEEDEADDEVDASDAGNSKGSLVDWRGSATEF
ncbi:hypothetical protein FNF27_06012 [Cafeteria roenbergensis]|uniref:EF-hand domain-containing protein n=1 Tax=Cafeteria roenbergensis TaxID=33653 RepID=A0A5A8E545_CAFRO|nr:hypothetical protein FNF27_06012 [Cafeteria roenbergensis]